MRRTAVRAVVLGLLLVGASAAAQDCPREVSFLPFLEPSVVAVEGELAYFGSRGGLVVEGVSDPAAPLALAHLHLGETVSSVAVTASVAYVGVSATLHVVDVSEPQAPVEVQVLSFPGEVKALAVSGNLLLVAVYGQTGGLSLLDISQPTFPVEVGSVPVANARDVAAAQSHACLLEGSNLRVVDTSSPCQPIIVGTLPLPEQPSAVAMTGSTAFVGSGSALRVVDLSTPASPAEVGSVSLWSAAYDLGVAGGFVYVADGVDGLRVVDVSSPADPVEVGSLPTEGQTRGLALGSGFAVLAEYVDGARVVDLASPPNPSVLARLPGGHAGDVMVTGSLAVVAVGFPPDGYIYGVVFVDMASSERPVELGRLQLSEGADAYAVSGSLLYLAQHNEHSTQHSVLRVFDFSDPSQPWEVGSLLFESPFASATDLAVRQGWLYMTDFNYGMRVIDISDPTAPVEVALLEHFGSIQVAVDADRDQVYVGWLGMLSGLVGVVDVSEPTQPVIIGEAPIGAPMEIISERGSLLTLSSKVVGVWSKVDFGLFDTRWAANPQPVIEETLWLVQNSFWSDMAVMGHLLFLTVPPWEGAALRVIDLKASWDPYGMESLPLPAPLGVTVYRPHVLVADQEVGLVVLDPSCVGSLFADGFASGTTSAWSETVP